MPDTAMGNPRPIVIFDGDCGLCNGFVAWLIRHDPHARFLISGSAGPVGRSALEAMGLSAKVADSTLVIATTAGSRLRSDAVVEVARGLGWPWRASAVIRVVPRRVRDGVYNEIAKRRPRRPAEDSACGTPPPELTRQWRARLATEQDVAALAGAGYEKTPHRDR